MAPRTKPWTADERDLILLGYIAFLDPPKESAAAAIAALAEKGVRVKILTGDNEVITRKVCREVKLDAGEWFAQPESIKKGFQIQAAAQLEIGDVGFAVPISAPRKIALAVAPLAMCDVQVLVIPFGSSGQVSHFVTAAL